MAFPPTRNLRAFSLNDLAQAIFGLPDLLLLVGGQMSTESMFHAADGPVIVCNCIKNVQQNLFPIAAKDTVAGSPDVDKVTSVIATTYGWEQIRFCDPIKGRVSPSTPVARLTYSNPDVAEQPFRPSVT
jgi:hypothetical protein